MDDISKMSLSDFEPCDVDLLDMLLDQNDGVLMNLPSYPDSNSQVMTMPELTFNDIYTEDFLNNLNDCDLLNGFCINTDNDIFGNKPEVKNSAVDTLMDHQYCRHVEPNVHRVPSNTQTDSPQSRSDGLFSSSNSPSTSFGQSDDAVQSPCSYSDGSEISGGNSESVNINGLESTIDPSTLLLQNEDFMTLISNGEEDIGDLLSLDMDADFDSASDEGCDLLQNGNASMFNFSSNADDGLPFTIQDIGVSKQKSSNQQGHQDLRLSDEEKALLAREGYTLPNDLPLTKEEERALKAVRRKIRNKISAKVSRQRKNDYVVGLEKRVKVCTMQNKQLQQKVEKLAKQNTTLMAQLKKFQMLITPNLTNNLISLQAFALNRQAQTGTCIMVLVFSFALFILPNLSPLFGSSQHQTAPGEKTMGPGNSRSILQQNTLYSSPPPDVQESYSYKNNIPFPFSPEYPSSSKTSADVGFSKATSNGDQNETDILQNKIEREGPGESSENEKLTFDNSFSRISLEEVENQMDTGDSIYDGNMSARKSDDL